eukprot:2997742-Alexandrium_andersonii.AAC.1
MGQWGHVEKERERGTSETHAYEEIGMRRTDGPEVHTNTQHVVQCAEHDTTTTPTRSLVQSSRQTRAKQRKQKQA